MEIFKANKSILKISGLLTNTHKSFLYKLYGFLIQLGLFMFIIPLNLIIFSGKITDLTVLSIQVAYNFEAVMTFIKVILFVAFNKNIFHILEKLQSNVNLSKITYNLKLLQKLKLYNLSYTRNPVE